MQRGEIEERMTERKKTGRPSTYNLTTANKICNFITSGRTLTKVCKRKDMPHITTVLRWKREHEEFCKRLDQAFEDRKLVRAEEMTDIAAEYRKPNKPGNAADRRLAIDVRRLQDPARFSQKLDLDVKGDVKTSIEWTVLDGNSEERSGGNDEYGSGGET